MPEISVVAIYQSEKKKSKLDRGTVHIKLQDLGIDVKNIKYHINDDKSVFVSLPNVPYSETKEDSSKRTFWVRSVRFHDKSIEKEITEVVKKAVLENLEKRSQK